MILFKFPGLFLIRGWLLGGINNNKTKEEERERKQAY
jgi:hypothetical protein